MMFDVDEEFDAFDSSDTCALAAYVSARGQASWQCGALPTLKGGRGF